MRRLNLTVTYEQHATLSQLAGERQSNMAAVVKSLLVQPLTRSPRRARPAVCVIKDLRLAAAEDARSEVVPPDRI